MWELSSMLEKAHPAEWGWVKITFVTLLGLTILGIRLKSRVTLHVSLQLLSFLGLCFIFGYGVYKRGVLGSSMSSPHGWIYYSVLIPHVTFGFVYAVLAVVLFVTGRLVAVKKRIGLLWLHRKLGWGALLALALSVLLSLPL